MDSDFYITIHFFSVFLYEYYYNINTDIRKQVIKISQIDLSKQYNAIDWFEEYSVPLQFITCILTLQFMTYRDRKDLLRECCDRLEKGGAMIVVEKIIQEDGYDQKIFDDIYQEMK